MRMARRFRSAASRGPSPARSVPGRRARLWALVGLGLSALFTTALAITVAIVVGCRDYKHMDACYDPRIPTYGPFVPLADFETSPSAYAALEHANMDLLEAAPIEYAAWVRANGISESSADLACRQILLRDVRDVSCRARLWADEHGRRIQADEEVQRYVQREAALQAAAPAEYAARETARGTLLAASLRFRANPYTMPFLRYSPTRIGTLLPTLSVGEAVGWRRATRTAAQRRIAQGEAGLREAAAVEYGVWRQRGGDSLSELAALIEAAPAAYATWRRALADLAQVSPATYFHHRYGDLFGNA